MAFSCKNCWFDFGIKQVCTEIFSVKCVFSLIGSDNAHDKVYIMLRDRLGALFKTEDEYTILEEMKGESLVGKKYQPLFDYFAHMKSSEPGKGAFRVIR